MFNVIRLFSGLFFFMAAVQATAFEVSGLAVPESFIVDAAVGNYYISNINGKPLEKNNNGFITKLRPDGRVLEKKFVEGGKRGVTLNAPKGLLIIGGVLYVSDIDHVRAFDKENGEQKADIDLTSFAPKFLNDLAGGKSGKIYVTGMGTNRVFVIDTANRNKVSVLASGDKLASPNGIRLHKKNNRLVLNTWDTGEVFWLDFQGNLKKYTDAALDKGLDGIDFDDEGNLYVSSFTGGKIFRISPRGKSELLISDIVTPADISLDRKKGLILIPSFKGDRVFTMKY
ncbi:MAG: ATP/GTP-binding protein [bacterium]|nr:MAG: ATP/GTP-binding protein [bacterium]